MEKIDNLYLGLDTTPVLRQPCKPEDPVPGHWHKHKAFEKGK
jgi:hypothetical protein